MNGYTHTELQAQERFIVSVLTRRAAERHAAYDAAHAALLARDADTVAQWQAEQAERHTASQSVTSSRTARLTRERQARQALRLRHRAHTARRANVAQAVCDTRRSAQSVWLTWQNHRAHGTRLTYSQRDLVKYIANSERRYRLWAELQALGNPAETVRVGTSRTDSYGTVQAREARVNTRGAYGIRGIKSPTQRVSTRDAHAPALALRPLPMAVGHATIPAQWQSTHSERDALLLALRRDPTLCTVRVTHGAPWVIIGQSTERVSYAQPVQALPASHVVPVSHYRTLAEQAREQAREAEQARRASVTRHVQSVAERRLAQDMQAHAAAGSVHTGSA